MLRRLKSTFQQQRATENGPVPSTNRVCVFEVTTSNVGILAHHSWNPLVFIYCLAGWITIKKHSVVSAFFPMGAGLQRVPSRSSMMPSFRFENGQRVKMAHCDEMAIKHLRFNVSRIYYQTWSRSIVEGCRVVRSARFNSSVRLKTAKYHPQIGCAFSRSQLQTCAYLRIIRETHWCLYIA